MFLLQNGGRATRFDWRIVACCCFLNDTSWISPYFLLHFCNTSLLWSSLMPGFLCINLSITFGSTYRNLVRPRFFWLQLVGTLLKWELCYHTQWSLGFFPPLPGLNWIPPGYVWWMKLVCSNSQGPDFKDLRPVGLFPPPSWRSCRARRWSSAGPQGSLQSPCIAVKILHKPRASPVKIAHLTMQHWMHQDMSTPGNHSECGLDLVVAGKITQSWKRL